MVMRFAFEQAIPLTTTLSQKEREQLGAFLRTGETQVSPTAGRTSSLALHIVRSIRCGSRLSSTNRMHFLGEGVKAD